MSDIQAQPEQSDRLVIVDGAGERWNVVGCQTYFTLAHPKHGTTVVPGEVLTELGKHQAELARI